MNKNRGDIWLLNLEPTIGSEINKVRPAVIISRNDYNRAAETITVIPISSGRFLPSFHVKLSGLTDNSHAVIPQIRVASKKRFLKKINHVTQKEMEEIIRKLSVYLDI